MRKFKNVNELVNELKPDYPVYCIRPESIKKSIKFFKDNFPGKVLYAVKTNPNEKVVSVCRKMGDLLIACAWVGGTATQIKKRIQKMRIEMASWYSHKDQKLGKEAQNLLNELKMILLQIHLKIRH